MCPSVWGAKSGLRMESLFSFRRWPSLSCVPYTVGAVIPCRLVWPRSGTIFMALSIPSFRTSQVIVAGDVMLDRYWFGPTSRISPEAPVPIVKVSENDDRAGGAANVAINLTTLGVNTRLLGITGSDEAATHLEVLLKDSRCRL